MRQKLYLGLGLLVLALLAVGALAISPQVSQASQQVAGNQPYAATYRGVVQPVHFDVSPPLRSMQIIPPGTNTKNENEELDAGKRSPNLAQVADPVVQMLKGALAIPTPIVSFDGPPNLCNCSPPDPNGEVGPNHVVVMSNLDFQIFSKTGTSLFGPAANNTLWSGFGGGCQTRNDGDPVVLYDQLADRWMLAQFTAAAPYLNCIALSTTNDPTGSYYRWAFPVGNGNNFGDYEKFGMMPQAYFISTREFAGGSTFVGVGAYAGNRAQMLAGNPNPTVISFLAPPSPAYVVGDGLLPADLDGTTLPPTGSDEYYMGSEDDNGGYGAPADALTLWKFHTDFATPANSSFTLANTIASAPFNTNFPPCGGGRNCVPQPGTTNRIDSLTSRQRPIFRLAYRNMGSYETLLTNQSVNAGQGPTEAVLGARWWEVRSPASNPVIYQQGTYAPGVTDGIDRWMGSIAMNAGGSIALGYSASSATVFPSVYYTGRLQGDPLGQMTQGEAAIVNGTGSQTGSQRWGDYTDMTVDPTDDCTFWYVNEYVPTTSSIGWRVRVGSFQFGPCSQGTPTPTVTGTPPTATRTSTPPPATNTPTATPTTNPCLTANYTAATATTTIVPGVNDVGNHTDDGTTTLNLPFSYQLYGQGFSTVAVDSNGRAGFPNLPTSEYSNACLPVASDSYVIYPYWDDLYTANSGYGIYTTTEGTAPNRVFDIEWRAQYYPGSGTANFELRLFENQSRFEVVYGSISGSNTSATSGVQRESTHFTQYFCNGAGGAPTGSVIYSQPPCPSPTPGPPTSTPTNVPPTSTATSVLPTSTGTSVPASVTVTTVAGSPTPTETACPINFSDVHPTDYFYVPVQYLYCHGVISGYADGTFRPYADTTRAQMVKIVVLGFGIAVTTPAGGAYTFHDVPPGAPFFDVIETAAAHNIISGYTCGTGGPGPCDPQNRPYFLPNNSVTRGQLSKIDVIAAGWPQINPSTPTFTDVPAANPFYTVIETAVCHGVVSGYADHTFHPFANATRGQISKIVYLSILDQPGSCAITPTR